MKLDSPIFQNADAARIHLEAQRWPHGPNCPHCGNAQPARITKMEGKAHRPGLYNCMECREQFTVTVGTVFERSKIALNKWLLATFLMASSKKGMSAHQLHRMLGVTYKTAWFMAHRIREAMKEDAASSGPLGGEGKTIEADETYFGPKDTIKKRTICGKPSNSSKRSIVALASAVAKSVPSMSSALRRLLCATCWSAMPTANRRSWPTSPTSIRSPA